MDRSHTSSFCAGESASASAAYPCAGVSSLSLCNGHRLLLLNERCGGVLSDGKMNFVHPCENNQKTYFTRQATLLGATSLVVTSNTYIQHNWKRNQNQILHAATCCKSTHLYLLLWNLHTCKVPKFVEVLCVWGLSSFFTDLFSVISP